MALRLDPRIPLVWRTPETLQVGVDSPVTTIDAVTSAHERLIAALQSGVTRSALAFVAGTVGVGADDVDALLASLAPALIDEAAEAARVTGTVLVDGAGPTADRLREMLASTGHAVSDDRRSRKQPDIVVLVAQHVIEPARHAHWLRRDIPHLPVVFGDRWVRIGPFVSPGAGPCLHCVDLAHADADAAWAAIATQLAYRQPAPEPALAGILAAATACSLVAARIRDGATWSASAAILIDVRTGETEVLPIQPHAACGCRALPGSATARAPRADGSRPVPSSVRANAGPA